MPKVGDIQIIDCTITPNKSFQKPGYVHFIDERAVYISTIDFDCVLYRDRFPELLEACANGNLSVVQDICVVHRHIYEKDKHGWTALMTAVYNNRIDVAKFLLSCGADIFAVNNHGTNLLMYSKEAWVKSHDAALFELFMGLGLNIYQTDFQGKSLADYCAEENISEIGKYKIPPPPHTHTRSIFVLWFYKKPKPRAFAFSRLV
jgi:ankyrin repeat protein